MVSRAVRVPSWQECDLAGLCSRAGAFAFDLDNTLARSKSRMGDDMASSLAALARHRPVAIISGGRFEQIRDQVLAVLPPETPKMRIHVMPTSGTRYYRWEDGDWRQVYAHDLTADERRAAMASLERRAREQGDWEENVWGPRIEDRGSQITFSALGQQAPVEAKEAWDPDNERKDRLARAVAADLPDLQVRSGGSTSVDISARRMDKAYAVRSLAGILGLATDEILFVGDRMDPDGNDYPAATAGALALRVRDPDDALLLVRELNRCLGGV